MPNVRQFALVLALSALAPVVHAQTGAIPGIDAPANCPVKAGAPKLQMILGVVPGMSVNETLAAFKCARPKTTFEVTYPGSTPEQRNKGPQAVRIQGVTRGEGHGTGYEQLYAELYGSPGKERVHTVSIDIQPPLNTTLNVEPLDALMQQRYAPTQVWKGSDRLRLKDHDGKDSLNSSRGCPYDFPGYASTRVLCGLNLSYMVYPIPKKTTVARYGVRVFRDDIWAQTQKNPG